MLHVYAELAATDAAAEQQYPASRRTCERAALR